ncbi:hypothetical protein Rsub_08222 [Raphidocelis subcapitata]|uniref:Nudix hydrolase domain-containing protein n=1 Tax=Raphidocelis subcapitata TaxID=307507 RepID=A0A2V0P7G8_9CHLO|nr:hypothetical protein Rsub_08222 [Raphidocelis subcapitata]|eukprot:GBF95786.1 hypothetical protein Rsub_08222 [Raphidocelis subcapitata]
MEDLVAHFETGQYRRNTTFLADAEYSRALDCFVKGCADLLVQDSETGEVLVVKRCSHPQPDWWFLGGRMQAGSTPQQSARANLRREAGIDAAEARFRPLCVMSMLWQMRKQPPAGNGTADIGITFLIEVSPEERAAVRLDPREHAQHAWLDPADVAAARHYEYHPALRRATALVAVARARARLGRAVAAGAPDGEVAEAARAFVEGAAEAERIGSLPARFVDLAEPEPAGGRQLPA